jgi:hypothetical protein
MTLPWEISSIDERFSKNHLFAAELPTHIQCNEAVKVSMGMFWGELQRRPARWQSKRDAKTKVRGRWRLPPHKGKRSKWAVGWVRRWRGESWHNGPTIKFIISAPLQTRKYQPYFVVWEQKPSVSKVTTDKTLTSSDTDAGSCCHLLHNPAVVTTVSWNYETHYCSTVILQSLFIRETFKTNAYSFIVVLELTVMWAALYYKCLNKEGEATK